MPDPAVFNEVVEAIYDIPDSQGSICRALTVLGSFCGTPDVHLLVLNSKGPTVFSAHPGAAETLARFWSSRDLARLLSQSSVGELVDIGRLVGYTCPTWAGGLAAPVHLLPDCDMTILVAPLPTKSSSESATVSACLRQVLPHLSRAIALRHRLESETPTVKSTAQLVQELPLPALLTDRDGRCIESNAAFGSLKDNLGVHVRGGRLVFQDGYLQDSWQSALRETVGTAVGRRLLADAGTGRQWKVHLQPVLCMAPGHSPESQQFVLALLEEQGAMPYAAPERIAAVSKLTPAELNVLAGLLQGYTGKVIARSRNASVNTVRSQIMSILTKTGHHSQKELIASFSASSFDPSMALQSEFQGGH